MILRQLSLLFRADVSSGEGTQTAQSTRCNYNKKKKKGWTKFKNTVSVYLSAGLRRWADLGMVVLISLHVPMQDVCVYTVGSIL